MSKKINYLYRELEGSDSYTFEEFQKEMQKFKTQYSDGKDFKISCYHSGSDYDNPYITLECYSPETKEEKDKRRKLQAKSNKKEKEEEYNMYLTLKKKYEGE